MNNSSTPPNNGNNHPQDRNLYIEFIRKEVEKGTGISLAGLKKKYNEAQLFQVGLFHVTVTKKVICLALFIPVEAGCRYKRTIEKEGHLVESVDEVICPFTRNPARLISTNPKEFDRLGKSDNNQLELGFD